jgi:hypothetical protein
MRRGDRMCPPHLQSGEVPLIHVPEPWEVRVIKADTRVLKTQDNLRLSLAALIRMPLLSRVDLPAPETCTHDWRCIDLGEWEWRLVWECRTCGLVCHCRCFERAIRADRLRCVPFRWPTYLAADPGTLVFVDGACDVCRCIPSTNRYCAEMYARSRFEQLYGAYVRKRMVELQLDGRGPADEKELERVANNAVRRELRVPPIGERHTSETALYRIIERLYPGHEVVHHYRATWLGRLELDVCIPALNLAVEYHGFQHFQPIAAWGGSESLEKVRARDDKKACLCRAQGLSLVVFTYHESIEPRVVRQRIEDALKAAVGRNAGRNGDAASGCAGDAGSAGHGGPALQ